MLLPFHIKLRLIKHIVKAFDKDGACFGYLSKVFTGLSSERLKAGIFDGPQICKLIKDRNFSLNVTKIKQNA